MAHKNFIDAINVWVRAGKGGQGALHFRRERFLPKGGPDGGNGGDGGSIYLQGSRHLTTLLPLRYRKHIHAEAGRPGMGNNAHGAKGGDVIIKVPLGTVAKKKESGAIIGEVTKEGERLCIAQGGRGGKGNAYFKSALRKTPRFAQPGQEGEAHALVIELKLMADVALVGAPNAGKSTLLATLSKARPKIANYPFTTLVPHLGVVAHHDRHMVVADIPGLLEGASLGKGLGHAFLKHIQRNKALLFVVSVDICDPMAQYQKLWGELLCYDPQLKEKKHALLLSKSDQLLPEEEEALAKKIPEGIDYLFISSHAHRGLDAVKEKIFSFLFPH